MATVHRAVKREAVALQLNRIIERGNKSTRTGSLLILSLNRNSRGRRSYRVLPTTLNSGNSILEDGTNAKPKRRAPITH